MITNARFFHRGKEARANGKPRELRDGRVSRENRAKWYEGWDEQNRMMLTPSPAERAESAVVLGRLKEFFKAL